MGFEKLDNFSKFLLKMLNIKEEENYYLIKY